MNTEVKDYLQNLRFGETQSYRQIVVLPLQAILDGAPPDIGLAEAVETKTLADSEVSEGTSVPQLLALHCSEQTVLIIDGEELIGAKQNRILKADAHLPGSALDPRRT